MNLGRLFSYVFLTALVAASSAPPAWSQSYQFGPWTEANGSGATVYDWDWDSDGDGQFDPGERVNSCGTWHVSDGPAKPFRDSQGRIQIVFPGEHNRRMLGTSFANLVPEQQFPGGRACGTPGNPVNATHKNPVDANGNFLAGESPDKFDGRDWVLTPYRTGSTIHTLIHHEYHGLFDPFVPNGPVGAGCKRVPAGQSDANTCWLGSATYAQSTDDGATYTHATPPNHHVASGPYQYTPDWGRRGLTAMANIINNPFDDQFYTMFNGENQAASFSKAKARNLLQEEGSCVARSDSLPASDGWHGWQGYGGFSATFPNPYPTEPANKYAHVCESVTDHLRRTANDFFQPGGVRVRGLAYDQYLERFILVGTSDAESDGAIYSLSPDLINWSDAQVLARSTGGCSGLGYPTIADPSDTSDNFERPGRTAELFHNCGGPSGQAFDRNLHRVPFKFRYRSATFEDGQAVHPQTGFDSVEGASGFAVSTTEKYEGTRALRATASGSTTPDGTIGNLDWRNGSDVWYSAAYKLPTGFANDNGGIGIMNWENAGGSHTGGVELQFDSSFALERDGTPIDSGRFFLPENKWFWIEVHQRLDRAQPLSEVFVDGRLVWTSKAENNFEDAEEVPSKVRFGYVSGSPADGEMFIDRATASESQRGAFGVPGGTQVPAMPTRWGVNAHFTSANLYWQPVPGATGYRIYRRAPSEGNANTPWQWLTETSGTAALDVGPLTPGQPYQYRITAFNSAGDSMVSAPKQVIPGGLIRVNVDVRDAGDNDTTDAQDFQYTASPTAGFTPAAFILDDDNDPLNRSFKTSARVVPGSGYSVAQVVPPGWTQISATCDNGSTPANITVTAGEITQCWFENRKN